MILRPSSDDDFTVLISWIADQAACKLWAGPKVRFPLSLTRLKEDLHFTKTNTFSLVDSNGALLGLGQIIVKNNDRIHLARIIIDPDRRNQGLGLKLCRLLIQEAQKKYAKNYFSLNVYANNVGAIKLYHKLGFAANKAPIDAETDKDCIYMVKR